MAYNIDEILGDIRFEVIGDRVIFKLKEGLIPEPTNDITNLIKVGDITQPSDSNVFSSLRVLSEIAKAIGSIDVSGSYLRKDVEDTATERINFSKGIKIGNAILAWDEASGALRISESVFSDKEVSAYGFGSDHGNGESGSLGGLVNVGQWADEVASSDRVIVQLAGATHWSSMLLSEIVGLDTQALASYLTSNNYATKSYVTGEISNIDFHNHDNKSILDHLTQDDIDVLSHLKLVDGRIKVDVDFYSTGEISAYGAGTGSTGGGTSYNRLDSWGDYSDDKAGYVLSAYLGRDLNSRLIAVENNSTTTISFASITGKPTTLSGYGITDALNINGVATSATKLANVKTIWGQNFDGLENVSGSINNVIDIIANTYALHNSTTNPYLKLASNGLDWYTQVYQDKLHLGYGISKSLNIDSSGNVSIAGNLSFNTSANQINTTSAVELALNYAGGGARHTSIFNGQGGFVMRAHSNGNVGIGTSEPQYRLDVDGTTRISDKLYLDRNNVNNTIGFRNNGVDKVSCGYEYTQSGFTFYNFTSTKNLFIADNGDLRYDNFIVKSSGNVGIGTTSPSYKLDVNGSGQFTDSLITKNVIFNSGNLWGYLGSVRCTWGNDGRYPTLYGSSAERWVMHINPHISYVQNGVGEYTGEMNGATIRFAGNYGATTAWDLGVGCNSIGPDKFSIGRSTISFVSIDNAGYFGIGTSSPQYRLDVNGTTRISGNLYTMSEVLLEGGVRIYSSAGAGLGISLHNESAFNPNYGLMFAQTAYKGKHGAVNGDWATYFTMSPDAGRGWIFTSNAAGTGGNVASISNWGNLTCSGEVTAYSASDRRLKTDIVTLKDSLRIIELLNPVSYKWNSIAKELNPMKGDEKDYGLIAQELESVMPELVHTVYDGRYKSIDYVKLIPHLVCAIKELKIEVDRLKK